MEFWKTDTTTPNDAKNQALDEFYTVSDAYFEKIALNNINRSQFPVVLKEVLELAGRVEQADGVLQQRAQILFMDLYQGWQVAAKRQNVTSEQIEGTGLQHTKATGQKTAIPVFRSR